MTKRPITVGYVVFYVLFLPDTWQVIMGVVASYFLTPLILDAGMKPAAVALVYFMVATIGYAASRGPARGFTRLLKKAILGDRAPR